MAVSIDEFKKFIRNKLSKNNLEYIDLISGDIHKEIGGYPSKTHSMPCCCIAMRELMNEKDIIIHTPPKGNGATLKIRYFKR